MTWNLDLTKVDADTPPAGEKKEFLPLPKGAYKCVITGLQVDDEPKTSKKGAKYRSAKLTLQVIDGDHKNRLVFYNVIVEHETSELAQRIGTVLIKKLAIATGAPENINPNTVGEMFNKPFIAVLDVEEGRAYTDANGVAQKYPDRNRVLDATPLRAATAHTSKVKESDMPAWLQA